MTSLHVVLAVLTVSNFATLQDLLKDLKYELGGHFEDIVLALMMPPADYDATSLRKAIKVSTEFIGFRQKGGWCKGGSGWNECNEPNPAVKTKGLSPYLGLQDSGIGLLGILGANKVSDESNSCSSLYMHEFG